MEKEEIINKEQENEIIKESQQSESESTQANNGANFIVQDILSQLTDTLRAYYEEYGMTNEDFYCRDCKKLMVDVDELSKISYKSGIIINPEGRADCLDQFTKNENGKKVIVHEPESMRWLLKGKLLHSCDETRLFRRICWDCFYKKLGTVIDIRRKARKSKWYKRIENGEKPIPPINVSSSDYFKILFDIEDEDLQSQKQNIATATEEWHIKKHGEEEGKKKFEEYRKKQGEKNKFEAKAQKYGWTKEQFDEFNQNRASTSKNFISRYGQEEGERRWKEYCALEAYVGNTEEYFIEKLGEEEGKKYYDELCKKKNFNQHPYSDMSQGLFKMIDEALGEDAIESKWQLKNNEFEIVIRDKVTNKVENVYRLDYKLGNKAIEFNGDFWHANPEFYDKDDILVFFHEEKRAGDIWEQNRKRLERIAGQGFEVLVVWEKDYCKDPEAVVKECVGFLRRK